MFKKKFDKRKLFTTSVTFILIFFFVGGFWIGLDRVRSMEGTFPPNDIKEGISPAPQNSSEAVDYLNKVIEKALTERPMLSVNDNFSVDSDSIDTDGSNELRSTLLFIKDGFRDYISSVEDIEGEISEVNFGNDLSELLRVPVLNGLPVSDFKCNYIYYQCPSCGLSSSEKLSSCEPCGSQREYFLKYHNEYEIELSFDPLIAESFPELCNKNFPSRSDAAINNLTSDVLDDVLRIDNRDHSYNSFKIYFKVNRLTDEITYLSFIKGIDVNADVSFLGKYAELGACSVNFAMNEYVNYSFTWPSLVLNKEILEIEPKGTDNLLATLTCEDPLSMTVTWKSSDESIAVVDADGYIDVTTKTGEAIIEASYEYLGKTYSDSCVVVVKVPVESMKMSKKNIDLTVGDSFSLCTKVSPNKATIQTVKWFSEDESVATVDSNGVVTAVSQGNVIIYAISDDGYFRSTCEVTVE